MICMDVMIGFISYHLSVSFSLEICKNDSSRETIMGSCTYQKTVWLCFLGVSGDECMSTLGAGRSADDCRYTLS